MSDYHSGGGYYGEDSLYQDSPKYVKKKKKAAAVSLDYNQCALVLDYEVQVTLVGDSGSAIDKRFDNQQKLIKLKFKPHTDVSALAKEIVQVSIHISLFYLFPFYFFLLLSCSLLFLLQFLV